MNGLQNRSCRHFSCSCGMYHIMRNEYFSGLYAIPILGIAFSGIVGLISGILSFLLLIIGLIAIGKVSKDSDARIPIASKLVNRAFGLTCTIQYKPASDASMQEPDTSNDHKD